MKVKVGDRVRIWDSPAWWMVVGTRQETDCTEKVAVVCEESNDGPSALVVTTADIMQVEETA